MKYLRRLSVGIALATCLCLAFPMNADAASPSPQAKSRGSAARSKASATQKSTKSTPAKRVARADTRSGKKQRAARKSVDTRDVWLKRAQESELLSGKASWYGQDFHNKATASGVSYDMYTFTAAHRTLPMGTVVKVTDQNNGKSVMVCVTDRGPYVRGRIIDLSYAAAQQLDLSQRGVSKVDLEVISDASGMPLKADHAYFIRYNAARGHEQVGPFHAFADAAAMHEALRQAHPEAEVILDSTR